MLIYLRIYICRVLTRCLETEAALREGDEPWHWETLFTETASEMQVRLMMIIMIINYDDDDNEHDDAG